MDLLRASFEEAFKIPFSRLALPGIPLQQIEERLWASPAAAAKPLLRQGEVLGFREFAPDGYFLVGFWGHGVNSYAFYYARADGWSHVCFRLGYGGVYMDNEEAAVRIATFLTAYFDFEKRLGRGSRLLAIEAMSEGRYEIVHPDGSVVTVEESMEAEPEFATRLSSPPRP